MYDIEALRRAIDCPQLRCNVPMAAHTTFRIGGPADLLLAPVSEEQLRQAMALAARYEVPCHILGNGSNILVRDGGVRGLVILIGEGMGGVVRQENCLTAGAGQSLTALAREALRLSLMGLEWACGIPGTVGGAAAMNAGAYGGEISQTLCRLRILHQDTIIDVPADTAAMGYRESPYTAPECVVLSATFALSPDDGGAAQRQADFMARRKEKQPLQYPSAGSTFKRPAGHFAGALIEEAGFKGYCVGGAAVSTQHAGFIINTGHATAQDVLRLMEEIQTRVLTRFGVMLEPEVRIIGEG